jgi:tetratricopeptide (TPR) repeat protein
VAIDRAPTLRNAEKLLRQGKLEPAIAEYLRVVEEHPQDWATANVLGDLYVRVGQKEKAVEQFARIAGSLSRQGFLPKAAALYKKVLKISPDDEHALWQAGEIAATQGLLVDARAYLTTLAERRAARGDRSGVAEIRIRLASLIPADFEVRRAAAYARIEAGEGAGARQDFKAMAADLAEKGRQTEALDILNRAAALFPDDEDIRRSLFTAGVAAGNVPAVAEGAAELDDSLALQQEFDAEVDVPPAGDLAAMEAGSTGPGALTDPTDSTAGNAVGEEAAEDDLKQWLLPAEEEAGEAPAPFDGVDLSLDGSDLSVLIESPTPLDDETRPATVDTSASDSERFDLSANVADLEGALGETDRWIANLAAEHAEVDLTAMLETAKSRTAQHTAQLAPEPPTEVPNTLVALEAIDGLDIDGVFEHFRNEASRRAGHIDAEHDYERAVALREAGQIEESIQALRASSRAPQQRFRAAAALGRIYQQRNDLPQAVEWFERAAEAPPPSPDEAYALFYELAASLESVGEVARALAICLELQAEAGKYRDLSECIARLSKAQGGGQS